ncbi:MAG: GNAT family N-acetyltransferase [Acaryochloridaceae cyanobacterium CSU_3_4]|nr:GNAT family N-acetyltransferase [Acaryochloridaceae cyanobacterium CSU_3_4]
MSDSSVTIRPALLAEDVLIAQHFYQLWLDNQVPPEQILPDWQQITLQFIANARQTSSYQGFIAEVQGQIVGSASCQLFAGLYPLLLSQDQRQYGYIWGVYVEADYRRQGIGRQLTMAAVEYLRSHHCTHAILHASPWGQSVYEQLGFTTSNEMRIEL